MIKKFFFPLFLEKWRTNGRSDGRGKAVQWISFSLLGIEDCYSVGRQFTRLKFVSVFKRFNEIAVFLSLTVNLVMGLAFLKACWL